MNGERHLGWSWTDRTGLAAFAVMLALLALGLQCMNIGVVVGGCCAAVVCFVAICTPHQGGTE